MNLTHRWLRVALVFVMGIVGGIVAAAPANAEASSTFFINRTPGTYGHFNLRFGHSLQCLDIPPGQSTVSGAWLEQRPCDGRTSQLWDLQVASNGIDFRIRSPLSGKCVNVDHADYGLGTHIIQWPCGAFSNEYFKQAFDVNSGTVTPPGNLYWFVPSQSTGNALNVANGSGSSGAKVILWQKAAQPNEYIELT